MPQSPTSSIDPATRHLFRTILEFEASPDFEERLKDPATHQWYAYERQRAEEELAYLQHQPGAGHNPERLDTEYERALQARTH